MLEFRMESMSFSTGVNSTSLAGPNSRSAALEKKMGRVHVKNWGQFYMGHFLFMRGKKMEIEKSFYVKLENAVVVVTLTGLRGGLDLMKSRMTSWASLLVLGGRSPSTMTLLSRYLLDLHEI